MGLIHDVSGPAPSGRMEVEERLESFTDALRDKPCVGDPVVASFKPFPYPWTIISQWWLGLSFTLLRRELRPDNEIDPKVRVGGYETGVDSLSGAGTSTEPRWLDVREEK